MKSYVQIYGWPDNLQIQLGERQDKAGVYCMVISRGPMDERHAYHLIFSTNEDAVLTKEQALQQLREVLMTAITIGKDVLFGKHIRETDFAKGLLQIIFNKELLTEEVYTNQVAPVLTEVDVEKIVLFAGRVGIANTYRWHRHWEKRFPGYKQKFY